MYLLYPSLGLLVLRLSIFLDCIFYFRFGLIQDYEKTINKMLLILYLANWFEFFFNLSFCFFSQPHLMGLKAWLGLVWFLILHLITSYCDSVYVQI